MLLDVQPDSPVPIFQQIVDQVIFGIAAGGLSEGTLIPSVRDLAGRHRVVEAVLTSLQAAALHGNPPL